jgi:nucleoid-associated protein YgaU
MRRAPARLGAFLALAILLAAPPLVVWRVVGAAPPSGRQLADAWHAGTVDAETAMSIGALVFYAVWAWLIVTALAEAARSRSGTQPHVHVATARTPTGFVRSLVRVVTAASAASVPMVVGPVVGASTDGPGTIAVDVPAAAADAREPVEGCTVVATGRETPYSLALEALADPTRRGEIIELNRGRCGPEGRAWSSGPFPAGMRVRLPPTQEVVIEPGDSWWAMAEEHLGDGRRWVELRDANLGRRQPDGAVVVAADTVVHPGWTIAVDVQPDAASPAAAGSTYVVEQGDTLAGIVVGHYGDDVDDNALVQAVFATNRGVTDPDGRALVDPDLIHPGMVLTLPAVPAPAVSPAPPPPTPPPATTPPQAPSAPSPPPAPASSAATPPPDLVSQPSPPSAAVAPDVVARPPVEPSPTHPPTPRDDDAAAAPAWVAASSLAGATLLATGLGALIASRRRQRLRASQPGEQLPPSAIEAAPLARFVEAASDAVAVARLDLALRALAARIGRSPDSAISRPQLVVRRDDGGIEFHLDRPRVVGAPWVAIGDGSVAWLLPNDVPLDALVSDAAGAAPPCPALVTVGRDDDGEVLLDVEAVGGLAIGGDPEAAGRLLRSIALELAVTPLADVVHVVAAGFDLDDVRIPARLHVAADAGAAVELAASLTAPAGNEGESSFSRRARSGDEPWEPVVVVLAPECTLDLDAIDARVTIVATFGRGWQLRPEAAGWFLDPADRRLAPLGLPPGGTQAVASLVAGADAPLVPSAPAFHAPAEAAPEYELLVRILGAVDVVDQLGKPVEFDRPKALELVVWLAQHRRAASRTAARTALWELDVSNATFSNVVSDARRALARRVPPPDGEEWLGRTYAESLPLHPRVVLDADLVAAAVERARTEDDAGAVRTLRDALELVRGAPYTGVHYLWPDAEALPAQLTLLITGVAVELARRCLENGDLDGVFDATATALAVLPGHEELVCLRMQAHAAAGDRAAVRREFAGYERAVLADPWSGGELAERVVALRAELLASAR